MTGKVEEMNFDDSCSPTSRQMAKLFSNSLCQYLIISVDDQINMFKSRASSQNSNTNRIDLHQCASQRPKLKSSHRYIPAHLLQRFSSTIDRGRWHKLWTASALSDAMPGLRRQTGERCPNILNSPRFSKKRKGICLWM